MAQQHLDLTVAVSHAPGGNLGAVMADASERSSMAQTRHGSLPILRRYIRAGSLFRRNAAAAVGV
jgi:hypothetical protein